MDNSQFMQGQITPNMQPGMPPVAPVMNGPVAAPVAEKKDVTDLAKTIVIIGLALALVAFIGLFVWKMLEANELSEDVNAKINTAVIKAVDEQIEKDEAEFLEREKEPYRNFAGPVDYGELSFEYPKTWSVYIAEDASNGGDYEAYLNPIEVNKVSSNTINALRVTIRNESFEEVAAEYQEAMEDDDYDIRMETTTINGATANRYYGSIPDTELSGSIVIVKIRDKTVVLQTDSELFMDDFNRLLETVKFNA